MAKRRKLEAPSAEDMSKLEAEFRRETRPDGTRAGMAPIAQVAADTASVAEVAGSGVRAEQARWRADADRLRLAEEAGLLIAEIPLEEIEADAMIRDRMVIDEAEQMELRQSIAASGLRLPVEVYELPAPSPSGARYGLLSGYRRLMALRALFELTENPKHARIRAIVRPRTEADAAFVSIVEENEVRAELSHYERGRIAVIAAHQGAFVNVEEAVNRLFATASKAKRSKVRSFATIFEELGDMLQFPENLTEKRGLLLAQAIRNGAESRLRDALAEDTVSGPEEEWAALEPVLADLESAPRKPSAGGRPRKAKPLSGWANAETLVTTSGITIRRQNDGNGFLLRFEGKRLDGALMDSLMVEIKALLDSPS